MLIKNVSQCGNTTAKLKRSAYGGIWDIKFNFTSGGRKGEPSRAVCGKSLTLGDSKVDTDGIKRYSRQAGEQTFPSLTPELNF